jgi:hypothetical protein
MSIGSPTGSVLNDVLQLQSCELVVFNLTPDLAPDGKTLRFNPGVMIELGIALDQENPPAGTPPWGGMQPKPTFDLLCDHTVVSRSVFTPIIGDLTIKPFVYDPNSADYLPRLLEAILKRKIADKVNFSTKPSEQQGFVPPSLTRIDQ